MIATVLEGTVTQVRKVKRREFEQFRRDQFAAFKETEEYEKILLSTLDRRDQPEEEAEDFLFSLLAERYLSILFDNLDEPATRP